MTMKKITALFFLISFSSCLFAQSDKETIKKAEYIDSAIKAFNNKEYSNALYYFEEILNITNKYYIDSAIIFNAGLAAYNAENYEKAVKYFQNAAEVGYNKGRTYRLISASYILIKDTASALKTLHKGFQKYPDDKGILSDIESIDINIALEPDNTSLQLSRSFSTHSKSMIAYENKRDSLLEITKTLIKDEFETTSAFNKRKRLISDINYPERVNWKIDNIRNIELGSFNADASVYQIYLLIQPIGKDMNLSGMNWQDPRYYVKTITKKRYAADQIHKIPMNLFMPVETAKKIKTSVAQKDLRLQIYYYFENSPSVFGYDDSRMNLTIYFIELKDTSGNIYYSKSLRKS
jgi:tetratricopeptide (TPR) repeat protein